MNLYAFINVRENPDTKYQAELFVNEEGQEEDDLVLVKHQNTANPPPSSVTLELTQESREALPQGAKAKFSFQDGGANGKLEFTQEKVPINPQTY